MNTRQILGHHIALAVRHGGVGVRLWSSGRAENSIGDEIREVGPRDQQQSKAFRRSLGHASGCDLGQAKPDRCVYVDRNPGGPTTDKYCV